jgi:catalase
VYESYIDVLNNIDFDLAKAVAVKVNGKIPTKPGRTNDGKTRKGLSQLDFLPKVPTIATRRIAILISDGFNAVEMQAVRAALTSVKAVCYLIGPRRNHIRPMAGQDFGPGVFADHHFDSQRSTLFDAIYIPSGEEHVRTLARNGRVVHWVREAFGHCKAIAAVGEGVFYQKLYTWLLTLETPQALIYSVALLDFLVLIYSPLRAVKAAMKLSHLTAS